MGWSLVLLVVAVVGFVTTLAAGIVYAHRHLPRVYPRERTRLETRTYRVVRGALAVGVVVGAFGAILSLVDTVGTIHALETSETSLLSGVALLVPAWLGQAMVTVGVGLLVGGALLAGVVEMQNGLE